MWTEDSLVETVFIIDRNNRDRPDRDMQQPWLIANQLRNDCYAIHKSRFIQTYVIFY